MTFLTIFLSALYEAEGRSEKERCIIHPLKSHEYWNNEITDYASDMNVILAYYNFLDDWEDDRKILSLCGAELFKKEQKIIEDKYPRQTYFIKECLRELSVIEKSGELNPDIPANCFGKLMGEIFAFKEDELAESLREFGRALGRFIYIMDACLDLKEDIKNESYNPMVASSSGSFGDILNLLMAECTEKYKQIPISQDKELIENILYSGVWTKYEAEKRKEREADKK
jgi:hypothetical protein